MLDLALRNLWARKTRTILVIVGVIVCVFLINTVDGMLSEMKAERERDVGLQAGRLYLRQPGSGYPPFGSTIPEVVIKEALSLPELDPAQSTPLLLLIIVPSQNPMDLAEVAGVGLIPGRERLYLGDTPAEVGASTLYNAPDNAFILGADAARHYAVSVGQKLDINGEVGEVVGILAKSKIDVVDKVVLMSLSFAQRAFGREGTVSAALLAPKESGRREALISDFTSRFPKLELATEDTIGQELSKTMQMPNQFMGMISWTVFAAAILMVANVMLGAVRERTKEIGTLAALGMRPRTIMLTILYEALISTSTGGILGIVLSIPAAHLADWTWILSYKEIAKVGALVLLAGCIAGLYPAYRAARVNPVEALRYE